jgi:hypothetical protein
LSLARVTAQAITGSVEAYGSAYEAKSDRFHRPNTKETKKIKREEKKRGEKLAKGEEISPCGRATS